MTQADLPAEQTILLGGQPVKLSIKPVLGIASAVISLLAAMIFSRIVLRWILVIILSQFNGGFKSVLQAVNCKMIVNRWALRQRKRLRNPRTWKQKRATHLRRSKFASCRYRKLNSHIRRTSKTRLRRWRLETFAARSQMSR